MFIYTSQGAKNISPNSELLNLFQVEELEQRYEMGWGGDTCNDCTIINECNDCTVS